MNRFNVTHFLSGIFILFCQIFLLKNIQVVISETFVISVFLYPLIIIAIPIKTPRAIVLTVGFFTGLLVDVAYDSLGLHTAALTFTAFARGYVLQMVEPRGGYNTDSAPNFSSYKTSWYLLFVAIMILIHILAYFSIDAFAFVYIAKILVNTLLSFGISFLLIILYSMVFKY